MILERRDIRLVKRTFWLIRHRWIAIGGVIAAILLTKYVFKVELQDLALYSVALLLIVENIISFLWMKYILKCCPENISKTVKFNIHFQISIDLIALTLLLHYAGGIGNPMFLIYLFHMVIASILLSKTGTYIQTTFALLLFGLMVYFEYTGVIEHYCLCKENYTNLYLYLDDNYILRTFSVFVFASYVLVYLASSIGERLRNQEDGLTKALDKLNIQDEIKNEYVLRVTHDIKGNLAAIQTNLAVLTQKIMGPIDPKQEEFLNRAYIRTIKLTKFVKNLLRLTRLRLDEEFDMEFFSVSAVIQSAISSAQANADEKSIDLIYKLDDKIGNITGNKLSIEEIITNLLLNAVKYTNKNGFVKVNTIDNIDHILIEVEDNGLGIPGDELSEVFEEFYRGSNVKNIEEDSTGIGLSLVKKIVDRHHGEIWVESELGKGSKFCITLPKNLSVN